MTVLYVLGEMQRFWDSVCVALKSSYSWTKDRIGKAGGGATQNTYAVDGFVGSVKRSSKTRW